MSTSTRLRHPFRSRPAATVAAGLLSLAALTSCGSEDGSASSGSEASPSPEVSAHQGEVCPDALPEAEAGADTSAAVKPAPEAPVLPAAEEAWVCQYQPGQGSGAGSRPDNSAASWMRSGEVREVASDELAAFDRDLAALEPADESRVCTMDLGPRWMLVTAHEGDLTGVVVDDFGCRDVLLTSDPLEAVAGKDDDPSVVPGALSAPASLLALLRSGGADSGSAAGDPFWSEMTARLDCPGPASTFMHDMSAPDADATIREALEGWERPGGTFEIDSQTSGRAAVSVVVDSEVVQVLAVTRWQNGGWAVEGGAEC